MGSRSSKHDPKSYDIAPVVSDKDFSYKRTPRPLPEIKLPSVIVTPETPVAEEPPNDEEATKVEPTVVAKEEIQVPVVTSAVLDEKVPEVVDPRIPTWVNETNIKPLLMKQYPNLSDIVSFKAQPALAAGENYATLMLRVYVTVSLLDGTTKDLSYMLKVAHDNKEMKEMLQHINFFQVENSVYNEIIPEMEEMYRKAGVNVSIGPKAYRMAEEAPADYYVLLEDLRPLDYKNANRLECLDMEHTKAVLRLMAQFHAASAVRYLLKGEYSEKFNRDLDTPMTRGFMQQMFSSFKKPFLENMKHFENGDKYYDAMENFFDCCIEEFIQGRKPNPEHFNVLNHGDSWSNNILFKYDSVGKLEDVLYVDFQNTNYGSPAQDLFYFIISSTQVDIKISKFEYFINYYHQQLVEHLNLLAYPKEKIPSLRELHKQLICYGSWASSTAFMTMGIVLLDPTDNAKFENFMGEEKESVDFKNAMYNNPRYIKHINEVLPWLYNHGYLEPKFAVADKPSVPPSSVSEPAPATTPANNYPEWLNESYFEDILRGEFENYQKIVKFNVSPATNAGDNYSSIMLKTDIDIGLTDNTQSTVSYMVKIPPSGEEALAMIAFLGSFVKETIAYNNIITKFEKIFKDANVDVVFGPKSYKPTVENGVDTLILENLRLKGFKNANRLQGLDMKHTLETLKKLAQFHAASACLFEAEGHYPEIFERSAYRPEYKEIHMAKFKGFFNIFLDCCKQYDGHEEYIERMTNYFENSYDSLAKAFTPDFNKFNVLNHGDCWLNNIMFQYTDEGEISNTYFVDFQLMCYGSPAYDLYYFILSSTQYELKIEKFDYFVRFYHENLKSCLEQLKYPKAIPSLKDLHVDLLEHGPFAAYASSGVMCAALLDPTENASLETMLSGGEDGDAFKRNMYLNPRYRKHAEIVFPWMARRGLFELVVELPSTKTPEVDMKNVAIPPWIDAEHFEDVMKCDFPNLDKITNITAHSATKPGDNYASSLLRVKVEAVLKDGSSVSKSYIVKFSLASEKESGMVSVWNFFEKEILMYSKYLPEFEELYGKYGGKFNFGPKSYKFAADVGADLIIMEDLSESGFKCGNRREGLDMAHVECALTKLAQFHAVSAKYVEVNGQFPEKLHKGIYSEESRAMFEHMDRSKFAKFFTEFENNEEYIDKVPALTKNMIDICIRLSQVDPTEFNVLNHGDSWLNNIMFKHDDAGNIAGTYFVDFQVCKYGSPAQDLWYFIMSSTELSIKVDSFDYFIRYYQEKLEENLKMLEYAGKVPSLSELHQVMLKYGYLGFNTTFGTTAVCLLESNEHANLANFTADTPEGDAFREALFLNSKYKANAAIVFPWLARRGCLD
ncbi:uncharacterized protein [Musca autumnalis]|uniref:uncharacterized protein n=1 Tax=Musca autumnalis TaxID=221902 RepID=UPI003CE73A0C